MWYNRGMRNQVRLCVAIAGVIQPSHFTMREFESQDGLVCIEPRLIESLERVRADLCALYDEDVQIVITSGTRTEADNEKLAERLGWCEDGGAVSRNSRHLPKFGGIAVDCYARYPSGDTWTVVPQNTLGSACKLYFTFVKDDYADGHVHADCRKAD